MAYIARRGQVSWLSLPITDNLYIFNGLINEY